MKGTALLINKDHSVTVLENVDHDLYEELTNQDESADQIHCTVDEKEITFDSISTIVWYEDSIDWAYGY